MQGLTAFQRHKRLLREYEAFYGGEASSADQQKAVKSDLDTLKEQYRFIRTEEDDKSAQPWEVALAQKYYSRLFREYAVVDLSKHKEGKLGCRWRTHGEVVAGKGQFTCGAKSCSKVESLETYEVPFKYVEAEREKQALVKVRLCPEHGMQLNYTKNRNAIAEQQEKAKKRRREDTSPKAGNDAQSQRLSAGNPVKGIKQRLEEGSRQRQEKKPVPKTAKDIEAEVDNFLDQLLL